MMSEVLHSMFQCAGLSSLMPLRPLKAKTHFSLRVFLFISNCIAPYSNRHNAARNLYESDSYFSDVSVGFMARLLFHPF